MGLNVYEIVTEQILKELEAGVVPWHKPWMAAPGSMPISISGHLYRGINVLLLAMAGRSSNIWMTFKQALEHGGNVKKGEKGTLIVFWKINKFKDDDAEETEDGGKTKTYAMLRYYKVFNLDQTENVVLPKKLQPIPAGAEVPEPDPIAAAEAVITGFKNPPKISLSGGRAFYVPTLDAVTVPPKKTFDSIEEFYSTMFHELTHSTGHESRLNRSGIVQSTGFGTANYGEEELIAEFGSAFLCGVTGIETKTVKNSAAYIEGWRSKIAADKKLVVMAAARAQKAADLILGRSEAKEVEE